MRLTINIEKKYVWLILLAVVAVGLVIAYGGTNPQQMGHSLGEIGLGDTNIDKNNNGIVDTTEDAYKLRGKTAAEYLSTSCRVVTVNSGNSGEARATCAASEVLTGGGCTPSGQTGIRVTRPEMPAGQPSYWYCLFMQANSEARAICCQRGA